MDCLRSWEIHFGRFLWESLIMCSFLRAIQIKIKNIVTLNDLDLGAHVTVNSVVQDEARRHQWLFGHVGHVLSWCSQPREHRVLTMMSRSPALRCDRFFAELYQWEVLTDTAISWEQPSLMRRKLHFLASKMWGDLRLLFPFGLKGKSMQLKALMRHPCQLTRLYPGLVVCRLGCLLGNSISGLPACSMGLRIPISTCLDELGLS